jgi:uncharacterized protein (DUF1778 family)
MAKDKRLYLRISDEEKARIRDAAKSAGRTVTAFVSRALQKEVAAVERRAQQQQSRAA